MVNCPFRQILCQIQFNKGIWITPLWNEQQPYTGRCRVDLGKTKNVNKKIDFKDITGLKREIYYQLNILTSPSHLTKITHTPAPRQPSPEWG